MVIVKNNTSNNNETRVIIYFRVLEVVQAVRLELRGLNTQVSRLWVPDPSNGSEIMFRFSTPGLGFLTLQVYHFVHGGMTCYIWYVFLSLSLSFSISLLAKRTFRRLRYRNRTACGGTTHASATRLVTWPAILCLCMYCTRKYDTTMYVRPSSVFVFSSFEDQKMIRRPVSFPRV